MYSESKGRYMALDAKGCPCPEGHMQGLAADASAAEVRGLLMRRYLRAIAASDAALLQCRLQQLQRVEQRPLASASAAVVLAAVQLTV